MSATDNSGHPFDDIRQIVAAMPQADQQAVAAVRARNGELTKPAGSLGRLEWLVEWLAAWQAKEKPVIARPLVASLPGATASPRRASRPFPDAVNQQMLGNFAKWRRRHQPDLRGLRARLQGLRPRGRHAHQGYHA